MDIKQFDEVVKMGEEKIFGQILTITSLTEVKNTDLKPEYKNTGIKKLSHFQCHLFKKSYLDIVNTSDGAVSAGIEFKPLRKSYYNSIALNGFCSELISDPSKKYISVKFSGENNANVVYLSSNNEILKKEDILKEKETESGREKIKTALDIKVQIKYFNIENILKMSINKQVFIDNRFSEYENLI